jgi:hypothetical protein
MHFKKYKSNLVQTFTVIQHFGFPFLKFRVQKIYSILQVFEPKLRVFEPKLRPKPKFRVFKPKLLVFKAFFCSTETSGVDSGTFCDQNFGISYPYEVSNEVSDDQKPEKFSKFRAKINYCVVIMGKIALEL